MFLKIKYAFYRLFGINQNETQRNVWLEKVLLSLPSGLKILDAGAGELKNRKFCDHLYYISQDICEYEGKGDSTGLHTGKWDTSKIDIVSDITDIPVNNESFDVVLCSEVFEHIPDPLSALDEFQRILKPGGKLITTAPFISVVHFAPYFYSAGYSKYWYEYHLKKRNFQIIELTPNGDWFDLLKQELFRLPQMAIRYKDWCWPISIILGAVTVSYFFIRRSPRKAEDVATLGWFCVATKK